MADRLIDDVSGVRLPDTGWMTDEQIAERLTVLNGWEAVTAEVQRMLAEARAPLEAALKAVSGALVDAGSVPVPDDPLGYGDAVRAAAKDAFRRGWKARSRG